MGGWCISYTHWQSVGAQIVGDSGVTLANNDQVRLRSNSVLSADRHELALRFEFEDVACGFSIHCSLDSRADRVNRPA